MPSSCSRTSRRHLDEGRTPLEAALAGSREVGFTVLSMSLSLVAVFIPLLFMGGLVGRLFREFAVTLSVAVAVSLVVSLTTTPMLCARFLRRAASPRRDPVEAPAEPDSGSGCLDERPCFRAPATATTGRWAGRSRTRVSR